MKKSILWMMAAILTCGFATTSCTDGVNGVDNPVVPIPEPAQPDQASMFVENIKADGRYTPAKLAVGGRDVDIMRLDVADFEAAKAEFLKLLPEGVETTAFERTKFSEMFVEATYYLLNAPQENRKDSKRCRLTSRRRSMSQMSYTCRQPAMTTWMLLQKQS